VPMQDALINFSRIAFAAPMLEYPGCSRGVREVVDAVRTLIDCRPGSALLSHLCRYPWARGIPCRPAAPSGGKLAAPPGGGLSDTQCARTGDYSASNFAGIC